MADDSIAPQGNNMCCFIPLVANAWLARAGFFEWLSLKKKKKSYTEDIEKYVIFKVYLFLVQSATRLS